MTTKQLCGLAPMSRWKTVSRITTATAWLGSRDHLMTTAAIAPRQWRKPPLIKRAWLRWALGLSAVVYLALAVGTIDVNWTRVWEGLPRGARFFAAFFPPNFTGRWHDISDGILESLYMTVLPLRSASRFRFLSDLAQQRTSPLASCTISAAAFSHSRVASRKSSWRFFSSSCSVSVRSRD